ncbi:MAG: flap endonuclease Xni [Gammaproteobacteria bacterium]|nr:flap endonuclease Xni [Gammaproteobacteria bacterium]
MKALLVDGLNLVRRIHAAVPKRNENVDHHSTNNPVETESTHNAADIDGMVRSSIGSLQRALKRHTPSHCLVVFEHSGKNWRHRLFPDYKKKRPPVPSDLQALISRFDHALQNIGITSFSLIGYEADDVIATMASKISKHQGQVTILSTDRNYCQLLDDHIQVYDHFGQRFLDAKMIHDRFQIFPHQLPDLLALAGDGGLSIPGIQSVGKRTAAKLLNDHGTLENVLEASENIPGKLGSKLYSGKEDALLAQRLFTLKQDIELGINLNQIRYVPTI